MSLVHTTVRRSTLERPALAGRRIDLIDGMGLVVLRYGLVLLLVVWGTFKFFAFEANGIQPLVAHSPFLSWLYPIFGLRGTSGLIGAVSWRQATPPAAS